MNDEKKSYRALRPLGLGTRVEAGEVVELTDAEAASWGPDYVISITDEEAAAAHADDVADAPAETTAPVHQVGDTCTLADGAEGVFALDGEDLVCVAKEDTTPAEDTTVTPPADDTTSPEEVKTGDEEIA